MRNVVVRCARGLAAAVAGLMFCVTSGTPAMAIGPTMDVWEFGLQTMVKGRWVAAEPSGRVVADRASQGPWETFYSFERNGWSVLVSKNSGRCFSFEPSGRVVADRTVPGPWESMSISTFANGDVYMYAANNGKYVAAEGGGGRELSANRCCLGDWEHYRQTNLVRRTILSNTISCK